MSKQRIPELVASMAENLIAGSEIELVDVEFSKEGATWYLRVFIDKPGGVGVEDCRLLSQKLSTQLDAADPIPQAYTLEVSSPGLERPLKKEEDYHRFQGRLINVKTYQALDGQKEFQGHLLGLESGIVKVEIKETIYEIPLDKIAKARLAFEF